MSSEIIVTPHESGLSKEQCSMVEKLQDQNQWSSDPQLDAMCHMLLRMKCDMDDASNNDFLAPLCKSTKSATSQQGQQSAQSFVSEKDGEQPKSHPLSPIIEIVMSKLEDEEKAKAVKRLLVAGEDPNARDPANGRTALMLAAVRGERRTVQLLLAQQNLVHFGAVDNESHTALMFACAGGHDNVAHDLLQHLSSVRDYSFVLDYMDSENCRGDTAASLALSRGHVECAEVLCTFLKWCTQEEKKRGRLSCVLTRSAKQIIHAVKSSPRLARIAERLLDQLQENSEKSRNFLGISNCSSLLPPKSRSCQNIFGVISGGSGNDTDRTNLLSINERHGSCQYQSSSPHNSPKQGGRPRFLSSFNLGDSQHQLILQLKKNSDVQNRNLTQRLTCKVKGALRSRKKRRSDTYAVGDDDYNIAGGNSDTWKECGRKRDRNRSTTDGGEESSQSEELSLDVEEE